MNGHREMRTKKGGFGTFVREAANKVRFAFLSRTNAYPNLLLL